MQENFIQNKTYHKSDLLTKGEYEKCTFNHGNYSESDFSGYKFIDCIFNDCNFEPGKTEQNNTD
jgi:fluoroquinolone resistance protein